MHAAAPNVIISNGTLGGLMPSNSQAVTAYYLGIFSLLLPVILGIPAVILGVQGLKYANRCPHAKGKAHAWTGIIIGSLTTLGVIFLFLLPFILRM
jgi:hypothetical protein